MTARMVITMYRTMDDDTGVDEIDDNGDDDDDGNENPLGSLFMRVW